MLRRVIIVIETVLLLTLFIAKPTNVKADSCFTGPETMTVAVVFPNGTIKQTELHKYACGRHVIRERIPKNLVVGVHEITIWIVAAFCKMNLFFDVNNGKVSQIGNIKTNAKGYWQMYINRVPSKFRMTEYVPRENTKKVTFRYLFRK